MSSASNGITVPAGGALQKRCFQLEPRSRGGLRRPPRLAVLPQGPSRRAHTTRLGVGEVDSMWPAWVVERLDDRVVLLVVDDRDARALPLERREGEVPVR